MLTATHHQDGSFGPTPMEIMGLGAPLTDEEAHKMAKEIIAQGMETSTSNDLGDLFKQYSKEDRQKLASAIIAEGGNARFVTNALEMANYDLRYSQMEPKGPAAAIWGVVATASMAASAYHGYKRNNSVGWAIWWAIMGGMFPILTPVIGVAQGFGKPKK